MKLAVIFGAILIIMPGLPNLHAEIYHWIDENGVRHYGNEPPPENRNITVLFEEYHYDETADEERIQSDQEVLKALIEEIEEEDREATAEQERRIAAEKANQPLSREEMIESETQRLLKKSRSWKKNHSVSLVPRGTKHLRSVIINTDWTI